MAGPGTLGPGSNPSTIAEALTPTNLVFPSEPLRSEIPLWMKFRCYEFMNTSIQRALATANANGGAIGVLGSFTTALKANIQVPAPTNFVTTTSHNYRSLRNPSLKDIEDTVLGGLIKKGFDLIPQGGKDLAFDAYKYAEQIGIRVNELGSRAGFGSEFDFSDPDQINGFMGDTTYIPSGASRNYEIRLNMPCLDVSDSKAAGAIVKAFEALSLPTMLSLFSSTRTKYYHPPLWVFGIGPANSMAIDTDWSGYPQLSVLRTVSTRKTALDTNSLSAHGQGGQFKPVAYTTTLIFTELEPAFRQVNIGSVGTGILSRSSAINTGGVGGAAASPG